MIIKMDGQPKRWILQNQIIKTNNQDIERGSIDTVDPIEQIREAI